MHNDAVVKVKRCRFLFFDGIVSNSFPIREDWRWVQKHRVHCVLCSKFKWTHDHWHRHTPNGKVKNISKSHMMTSCTFVHSLWYGSFPIECRTFLRENRFTCYVGVASALYNAHIANKINVMNWMAKPHMQHMHCSATLLERHHSIQLMNRFSQKLHFSIYAYDACVRATQTPLSTSVIHFSLLYTNLSPITALAINFLNFIRKYTSAFLWLWILQFSLFFYSSFIRHSFPFWFCSVISFPYVTHHICFHRFSALPFVD